MKSALEIIFVIFETNTLSKAEQNFLGDVYGNIILCELNLIHLKHMSF